MIEPSEQIKARLDAEYADKGRSIAEREREHDRSLDGIAWEMGDWACERPPAYGDMTRLADEIDVPLGTLKNRASVARRIEPARRRDDLSWSHHAEVAGLEPDEGDAVLAEAALYKWSVDRLRHVMKERGARRAAEREVERLKAEVEALKSERSTPEQARRVIEGVRAEVGAGIEMIAEGYRRILAALESGDLAIAAGALHGNARRSLAPSFEAQIGRATDGRIGKLIDRIENALKGLHATGSNRHDAGTVADPVDEPMEAAPEAPVGDTS